MHPTDDVQARGGVMVARAAAVRSLCRAAQAPTYEQSQSALVEANKCFREYEAIRRLAASDAALARAIDAVPGTN